MMGGAARHFGDTRFAAVPTGLPEGSGRRDVKDHDEGSDVGWRWVCGGVSGGEFWIAQGEKVTWEERRSACCDVEVGVGAENDGDGVENDVERERRRG